jgi:hypothetical protein
MSADPSPGPSNLAAPRPLFDLFVWFAIGSIAVALFFSASVHLPQRVKLPGLSGIVLGILAGWGLGGWAGAKNLQRPVLVVVLTGAMIAAGEVLAAVQTHRLGLKPERSGTKPEQFQRDMLTEGMRQYYAQEPQNLTEEELARWREGRDFFERGERQLAEAREAARLHRSFYGYLANRIDQKSWGKWDYPWPAVFWAAEVVLGSTAGAWLAFRTWRAASPRMIAAPSQPNPDHEVQGNRA